MTLAANLLDAIDWWNRHGPRAHRLAEDWHGAPTINGTHEPRSPELWCDTHERTIDRCHHFDHPCTGIPLPEHHDRVGDAATNPTPTPELDYAYHLHAAEEAVAQALHDWRRVVADIVSHDKAAPGPHADPVGVGACMLEGCKRWMPGIGEQRIRAGLCSACYRAWRRAKTREPRLELATWRIARERHLAHHTPDEIEETA